MADDSITQAEFSKCLNDPEELIFIVGPNGQRYHIHRKLVLDETYDFIVAPLKIAEFNPDFRMLLDESFEVFDVFVSWLYNRNRTFQVGEDFDLIKLIQIYLFALTFHIDSLKRTIVEAIVRDVEVDFDLFFATVKQVFSESVRQHRWEISHPFDTITSDLVECKEMGDGNLLGLYVYAMRRDCNRLKNRIMDALQDTLLRSSSVLALHQVVYVFQKISHSPTQNDPLRKFCVALIHFHRFSEDIEQPLPVQEALKFFTTCENFTLDYTHFEQEVMFNTISPSFTYGDDPRQRKRGSFPRCYFHFHDLEKHEKCHLRKRRIFRV